MAQDLSTFLAVFGGIFDGPGVSWSIGGVPRTGIAGSHGNYGKFGALHGARYHADQSTESDSSPVRPDLHQYGNNVNVVMSQFYDLYNRQPDADTANYNLDVLRDFRVARFQQSIDENPYFSYQPFTGMFVSQAAFTFIYRFMANKSAEYPEGRLDKATLKSFYSIKGDDEDNLYWEPYHEQVSDWKSSRVVSCLPSTSFIKLSRGEQSVETRRSRLSRFAFSAANLAERASWSIR
jgi:hypothetical protein